MLIRFLQFLLVLLIFGASSVKADQLNIGCDNRYLTIINPVRDRSLWYLNSLKPYQDQVNLIKENHFTSTWLLQPDVLFDQQLFREIKKNDSNFEEGIFLEVSQKFATRANVIYPYDSAWFSPRAVFLSGYSQSERRKLIDQSFKEFKQAFGVYPSSVGAWWIDSYSLQYMKEKYNIKSILIVADQLTTDNYGVWGQWWGVPYMPSKRNVLLPANSLEDKLGVVALQWAQRDPQLGYGKSPTYSNFSLQANDYIRQGKNTSYFIDLVNKYLNCQNNIGQITIGLETGIESVGYIEEYRNQLNSLSKITNLKSVTMSQFANNYNTIYPGIEDKAILAKETSVWQMDPEQRSNLKLKDKVVYSLKPAFSDYFLADKNNFLNRNLTKLMDTNPIESKPYYQLVIIVFAIVYILKRRFKEWLVITIFILGCFGLFLKSYQMYGWNIFYGPTTNSFKLLQPLIILQAYLLFTLFISFFKKNNVLLYLIPLSFGLDVLVLTLRYTFVSGKYYLGFLTNTFEIVGISYQKFDHINFGYFDFLPYQAAALLKIDLMRLWTNSFIYFLINPMIHLLIGLTLGWLILKLPKAMQVLIILLLFNFLVYYFRFIYFSDPLAVLAANL